MGPFVTYFCNILKRAAPLTQGAAAHNYQEDKMKIIKRLMSAALVAGLLITLPELASENAYAAEQLGGKTQATAYTVPLNEFTTTNLTYENQDQFFKFHTSERTDSTYTLTVE